MIESLVIAVGIFLIIVTTCSGIWLSCKISELAEKKTGSFMIGFITILFCLAGLIAFLYLEIQMINFLGS